MPESPHKPVSGERRAQILRQLSDGTALGGLKLDLEIGVQTDDDEEVNGLFEGHSFASELSFTDLQRLRGLVKAVHMQYYPGELKTDLEADRIIDAMGPITREKLIRKAVDHGIIS